MTKTWNETSPYYDCCATPQITELQGRYVCINCGTDHAPIFTMDIATAKEQMIEGRVRYGERTQFNPTETIHQTRHQFLRMQQMNRTLTSRERSLQVATKFISKMGGQLDLPSSIIQDTLVLYKRIQTARLPLGRCVHALAAGAIYLVTLEKSFPCPLDQLATVSQCSEKHLRKMYRLIACKLDIPLKRVSPLYYIAQSSLNLSRDFVAKITQLIQHLHLDLPSNLTLDGTMLLPRLVAAAALYIISSHNGKHFTQEDVSKAFDTSEVTLRKYVKILANLA